MSSFLFINIYTWFQCWKLLLSLDEAACCSENLRLIEEIKKEIPIHHTRQMRKEFISLYCRISMNSKHYMLRNIFHLLTGDSSAASTSEEEIDKRVIEALEMEYLDAAIDLRILNSNNRDYFKVFWDKCYEYLLGCTAVQERRHGSTTFMAKAVSIRDLIQQVVKLCPEDTLLPSESYVRLNFCPGIHLTKCLKDILDASKLSI
jgi:hypothetical protein